MKHYFQQKNAMLNLHYYISCLALSLLMIHGKAEEEMLNKDFKNVTKGENDKCFYSPLQLIVSL